MAISKVEKNAGDLFMKLNSDLKGIDLKDDKKLSKAKSAWRKMFPNDQQKTDDVMTRAEAALMELSEVLDGKSHGGGKITTEERQGLSGYFSHNFIDYIAGKNGTKAIFRQVNTVLKPLKKPDEYVDAQINKGNNDIYNLLFAAVTAGHKPSILLFDSVEWEIKEGLGSMGYSSDNKGERMTAVAILGKLVEKGNPIALGELEEISSDGMYLDASIEGLKALKKAYEIHGKGEVKESLKMCADYSDSPVIKKMATEILKELGIDEDNM